MQVVDGMHRLQAAILRGDESISVQYFDGDDDEAFVAAVKANLAHGLLLSQADRQAAAERILIAHPLWSDRTVAEVTALSAKTVAAIRGRSTADIPQLNARIGRDGRLRPLTAEEGRRLASRIIEEQPDASLRQISQCAGISLGTARDVRLRVRNGQDPVPDRQRAASSGEEASAEARDEAAVPPLVGVVNRLQILRQDPSLRFNGPGRKVLHLLAQELAAIEQFGELTDSVPAHSIGVVAGIAREYSRGWEAVAAHLERRPDDV
jgi:ParB-like chromosome segregation protein Spo0J